MERKELAVKLIDFCIENRIFNTSTQIGRMRSRIERQLDDLAFVEYLIHMLITKAKYKEGVDFKKLRELLEELEKIRLDLE